MMTKPKALVGLIISFFVFLTCVVYLLLFCLPTKDKPVTGATQVQFDLQPSQYKGYDVYFAKVPTVNPEPEQETPTVESQPTSPTPPVTEGINPDRGADVVALNNYLYDICDQNFNVTVGGYRVSPLFPMAVSLIETGHRADTSITFSALYPSRIIPITSLEDIDNMGVLKVIETEEYYKALSNDFSTRDRGPLQMNPNYGAWAYTGHASEKEILANVEIPEYVDDWWLEACGETAGDRFNIRDCVGRLAIVGNSVAKQIESYYYVNSPLMACILLDINHGFSSVYNPSFTDTKIGNWVSGRKAVEYAACITTPEAYQIVKAYSDSHPGTLYITDKVAKTLYQEMFEAGIVGPVDEYIAGTGTYAYITYCHPIRAMYSLIALEAVYTGA